jgi:sulfur carrier protein ThiS
VNPASVIVVKSGKILDSDAKLAQKDSIKILEVSMGG